MKVWFITGAGSGIGTGIAKAALQAGDRVVATGRDLDKVRNALRDVVSENLAFIQLDVADEAQAKTAVDEAVKQFDRSDVLVNNAGYSLLGNFEEMTTADIESQMSTNFYGVEHIMQAVLSVMRQRRLGFFRTELLDAQNAKWPNRTIKDYAIGGSIQETWAAYNGTQQGDPAKLGDALVKIAEMENPPKQFYAGSDAVAMIGPALETRLQEIKDHEALSKSTDGNF